MDGSDRRPQRAAATPSESVAARFVMLSERQRRDFRALLRQARRLADANRRGDAARVMRIATQVLRGEPVGYTPGDR